MESNNVRVRRAFCPNISGLCSGKDVELSLSWSACTALSMGRCDAGALPVLCLDHRVTERAPLCLYFTWSLLAFSTMVSAAR